MLLMKSPPKGEGIYNVVVIGAGTAGLVTAAGTAGLGGRVALIERNKMGGDCLNFGCVPSKALISSARLIDKIRHAEKWGLAGMTPQFEFADVLARMRAVRAQIAPHDSQERFESLGVDVFRGDARFRSPQEVEVGDTILRGRNIVIATGSRATIPKIEGIENVRYLTNETIFDELTEKPESMIVLGGGPIGCELGQTFVRLGVRVTIVQRGAQLLPREDRDVSDFLETRLRDEGISVLKNAEAVSVRQTDNGIELQTRVGQVFNLPDETVGKLKTCPTITQDLTATVLLICAGRTPRVDDLGLEAIGVTTGKHGVKVNEYLQTTQPHIYAAGDVAGPFLFTHMADTHARVVVRNILMPFRFLRQKIDYSVVPWCTYVDPEIATVGLNESAAKEKQCRLRLDHRKGRGSRSSGFGKRSEWIRQSACGKRNRQNSWCDVGLRKCRRSYARICSRHEIRNLVSARLRQRSMRIRHSPNWRAKRATNTTRRG